MDTKQVYDRLLPVVAQIDKSVTCQSVTDNLNGTYTLLCKRTKWALVGFDITIGLETYRIESVSYNVSITVSGSVLPTVLTFDLYAPKFKHGTIRKVAIELNELLSFRDKTPLIFLHEIVEESEHFDVLDAIDIDADTRLYFLANTNFEDFTQLQGDDIVQAMRSLASEFTISLSVSQYVSDLKGIGTTRNHNLFGSYSANGVEKNIFNEALAGVEKRITIPFLKNCDCCDIPLLDRRAAPGYVYDQFGNVLAVLYSNETYSVTVLTEIVDTIDDNIATVVDNLN